MNAAWTALDNKITRWPLIISLLMLSTTAAALPCPASEHPNVILFLIDDLGCRDLASEGSTFHATPNLDHLLASGVRFTQFYSSHPVCSPTRASLMTGKAPHHHRITDWIHPGSGVAIGASEVTLAERFRDSGYQTAYLGKWHLGESDADLPTNHGFDWTKGVNRGGQPGSYYFPYVKPVKEPVQKGKEKDGKQAQNEAANEANSSNQPGVAPEILKDLTAVPGFEDSSSDDYLTDVLSEAAIDYLAKQRDPQRPFFLCLGHYAVHTPIEPPAELLRKYQAVRRNQFGDEPTTTLNAADNAVSRGRQDHPGYAAMVENLDDNIGRILRTLDEFKLRDDTIVVFTSDNGGLCTLAGKQPGPTCNLPYRNGKGWTYEGGIRITTSISWPAKLAARDCAALACTADLYPTLIELCGLSLDPKQIIDGHSLVKTMRGQDDALLSERSLLWFYPHHHGSGHRPAAAIRRGDWKLIHWFEDGRSELYQLSNDPSEQHDLAAQHPGKVAELKSRLDSELKDAQDLIPQQQPRDDHSKETSVEKPAN